jgi:methylmalonyl-CoA mutase cobalamin-binding domain/chain
MREARADPKIAHARDMVAALVDNDAGPPSIMIVVGGVIPPSDVQTLIDMGAAAVYPPGSVVAETAIDLIDKLNQRLGYAQKP